MRTTLTLEPDVAQEIERLRKASGRSLKRVINELLRAGLVRRGADGPVGPEDAAGFTEPVSCGELLRPPRDYDEIGSLLAELDVSESH